MWDRSPLWEESKLTPLQATVDLNVGLRRKEKNEFGADGQTTKNTKEERQKAVRLVAPY